jgi:hypothetical protein
MIRTSSMLRLGLLAAAGLLQACVTSPYYTPAPSGTVYYVQDPWHYRNSFHDCYQVWYGCPQPTYGHSHYRSPPPPYHRNPPPPARPPPPEKPVHAPKPPRLIRLGAGGSSAPGQVIRQPPAAQPTKPRPEQAPTARPLPPTNRPANPRAPQQRETGHSREESKPRPVRQEREEREERVERPPTSPLRGRLLRER